MNAVLDHLDQVSIFGRSSVAFFLILGLDWAFSAVHAYDEWRGEEAPLWRVFGPIVGLRVPNSVGFFFFTLVLTLALWSAGLAGICGCLPFVGQIPMSATVGALGVIIGARIADTLVSHWALYALGYRPNPGLKSTPLYVLEAFFIALTFWKGLSHVPCAAWTGIAVGALVFILVLPGLRALRTIWPSWARPPWVRWQPLPEWAKE
jgi:hypothetical protein